jgi:Effector-associated domain 11
MKQTLQNLLAEGKTKQVIDLLREVTKQDTDLHGEVLQLSARFEEMERQNRLNISETANINLERNRINNALLSVVNRLDDTSTPSVLTSKKWLKIGAGLVALIGIIASIAQISGYSLRDWLPKKEEVPKTKDTVIVVQKAPLSNTAELPQKPQSRSAVINPTPPQTPAPSETLTSLTISVKTDRSTASTQSYREGESIRLFVQATQPCYIRALYKLADGQAVLLAEDKQVTDKAVQTWVELGTGFDVSEPFGAEELHVFAQSTPFDDLKTTAKDGYLYLPAGMPEAVTATRRGLKPKAIHTETQLYLTTKPK